MQRQLSFILVFALVLGTWPNASTAAPWLSVVNNPAEIHFMAGDDASDVITLSNKVTDVQAVRINADGQPFIVALMKRKRRFMLSVYDYAGVRLARRTVRRVTTSYRIGAARLEFVKNDAGAIMQVRYIRLNAASAEPLTYIRQRYRIAPNSKKIIAKTSTRTGAITEPVWPDGNSAAEILNYYNAARLVSGVLPVKHDADLDDGCALHAEYMRRNDDMTHYEDVTAPGYTAVGAAAGEQSVLTYQYNDSMYSAIDLWLEAPYHRFSIMYPELISIGWAVSDALYYNEYYNKYFTCLNTIAGTELAQSGYDKNVTYWEYLNHEPIPYPGVNQQDVPILFHGNESPDPLEDFGGTYPVGYAVSLIFSYGDTVTDVALTLMDESGVSLPGYLREPNDPDDPNALYQGNAVLFMATEPFDYSTTYTVTITAQRNNKDYEKTWSFRTETE